MTDAKRDTTKYEVCGVELVGRDAAAKKEFMQIFDRRPNDDDAHVCTSCWVDIFNHARKKGVSSEKEHKRFLDHLLKSDNT